MTRLTTAVWSADVQFVKTALRLLALLFTHVAASHAVSAPTLTLLSNRWEQLIVPANSSAVSIRQMFADELSADAYDSSWSIYLYDSLVGEYVNPGIDGTIPSGTGFWIIQSTNEPVTLALPETIPATSLANASACAVAQCASVPLVSRSDGMVFNLTGSALPTPAAIEQIRLASSDTCPSGCSLDNAVAQQLIAEPLWHYNSGTGNYTNLAAGTQLDPWIGFWLGADSALGGQDATLYFPAQSTTTTPREQASRFLAQTTFGPTTAAIDDLLTTTYSDWIDAQIALPATSMLDSFDALQGKNPTSAPSRDWVFESFWTQAVRAEDQLRQRMAFALSQIFVISLREGAVASFPRGVADFYTMLSNGAFGNFRDLLEKVTLHPMMGAYLSHLGNEKGDALTGKVPDENFAREIMQLFSIGLLQLNPDGSLVLDGNDRPVETYTNSDVQGLARVFTGFSWNGPDTSIGRFQGWISVPDRDVQLMQAYPQFHSILEKRFLGTVINATTTPNPESDLAIALDTLFNHPNVGPFIGKQLIQRLVSSNPSADYVADVTAVFNDNGAGVRGDMRAVVRAILLHPEARDTGLSETPEAGRIREPILRLAHWMRSFNAESDNDGYVILGTDDPATSLGMTVLRSPSVFNFYRPGYVPANTPIADAGLVSPEMQITHETSAAGYLNSMLNTIELGTGSNNSIRGNYAEAAALAGDPQALIDLLDVLLTHGSMSDQLRQWLLEAIESVELANAQDPSQALLQRARIAVYLTLSSPEYIVLK